MGKSYDAAVHNFQVVLVRKVGRFEGWAGPDTWLAALAEQELAMRQSRQHAGYDLLDLPDLLDLLLLLLVLPAGMPSATPG